MRLLICAGGTGGGVYPALAVLQALSAGSEVELQPDEGQPLSIGFDPLDGSQAGKSAGSQPEDRPRLEDVLWVGGEGGMEAGLVKRAGVAYASIPAAGVHGVGLKTLPGNLRRLARGYRQSRAILKQFRPDVMFFTGGYVAVPMALAGVRVPSALYVPDIEPGLALKTLARFADCIAVTAPASQPYFAGRPHVEVTGYPVRPELAAWARPERRPDALATLGLQADLPVLLVLGGSLGARSINRALLAVLPEVLQEMQVIHISGQLDWPEVEAAGRALPAPLSGRYQPHAYLHEEMGAALAAADLVVSRAGASSLGEYPLFGLPAILVPYPHAWRYQEINAQYLTQHGAAILLKDEQLTAKLLPLVRELGRDQNRRDQMSRAMRLLAKPQAAQSIAGILLGLPSSRRPETSSSEVRSKGVRNG